MDGGGEVCSMGGIVGTRVAMGDGAAIWEVVGCSYCTDGVNGLYWPPRQALREGSGWRL